MTWDRSLPSSRLAAAAAASAPGPALRVVAAFDTLARLDVEWTLSGVAGPQRVCLPMVGSGARLSRLTVQQGTAPVADPEDGDCWTAAAQGGALRLRYRVDVAGLSDDHGDPDYAELDGGDLLFNGEAVFLRPVELEDKTAVSLELRLPPGATVAAPWPRATGPGARFAFTLGDDRASYVAVGKVVGIGEVSLATGGAAVSLIDRPHAATNAELLGWVERALTQVARLYGEVPGRRVHVVLVPDGGSTRGGVFGTVQRAGFPSVVLYFGGKATGAAFVGEWVAFHELAHLGNPRLEERLPWLTEGTATYYQDVLRGRAQPARAAELWGDLADHLRRFCAPASPTTLAEDSAALHRTRRYRRVYWGGACLAFRLDLAIRRRSGGKESLDTALRALRARGEREELDEDEVVAALDAAAGAPLAREQLGTTAGVPVEAELRELGVEATGPEASVLHDDAPLAAIRRAIF